MFPVNPIRKIREEVHLSQVDLAKLAHVSTQVVLMTEIGVYASPNPKVLHALLDRTEQREIEAHHPSSLTATTISLAAPIKSRIELAEMVTNTYREWRLSERDRALSKVPRPNVLGYLGEDFPRKPGVFDLESTRNWRRYKNQFSPSTVGFCKLVKLQPSIVNSFEASNFSRNWDYIRDWLMGGDA